MNQFNLTINKLYNLFSFTLIHSSKKNMNFLAFSHSDIFFSPSPIKHMLSFMMTSLHLWCWHEVKCQIIFSNNTNEAFLLLESYNSLAFFLIWASCCLNANILMKSFSIISLRFFFSLSSGNKISLSYSFLCNLLLCKSIWWYLPWKLHPSTKQLKVALEIKTSLYFSSSYLVTLVKN